MTKLLSFKEKVDLRLFMWFTSFMAMLNQTPLVALAGNDGTVTLPETTVESDGSVQFATGDKANLDSAVSRFLQGGNRVFGWIVAILGLGMMIVGGWQAYKASKNIQEGNQTGWGDTKNIIIGLLVGGALFAVIGLMIGFGVGFGNSLFE